MALYRISKKESRHSPLTNKCIILDLDETLVHSSDDYNKLSTLQPFNEPMMLSIRGRMYNLSLSRYKDRPVIWGITRPHLLDFLVFCFSYFNKVCVWSAGSREYVNAIVDFIFPTGYRPHIIYCHDDCHYTQEGDLFKPIEKMSQEMKNDIRLDNTFFIDDRRHAFIKNPKNGIHIPPYEPEGDYKRYLDDDPTLVELMEWLLKPEVLGCQDVRFLNKHNIFSRNTR